MSFKGCGEKCKKVPRVITEKIYEWKINLRGIVDKCCANMHSAKGAHNDDAEHGDFVRVMWSASILLAFAEICVMDLPFQILNVSSQDANLVTIPWVSIPVDIFTILWLLSGICCNRETLKGCGVKDMDYYPEKNVKYYIAIERRVSVMITSAGMSLFTSIMATNATLESTFAVWLAVLNFYKGIFTFTFFVV